MSNPSPSTHDLFGSGRNTQVEELTRPPVLLLSSGRCGSTLLQRVLNASPELTLWGEHAGFLVGMANSYFALMSRLSDGRVGPTLPYRTLIGEYFDRGESINWVNPFDPHHTRSCFRQLLIRLFARDLDPNEIRWGFKEILYGQKDRVVEMWRELFPETRYIFLTRHPYHVIRSMMVAWHGGKVEQFDPVEMESLAVTCALRWRDANSGIEQWNREIPERSILIRYEDVLAEREATVERLFRFLELPTPAAALRPLRIKVEETGGSKAAPKVDAFLSSIRDRINPLIAELAVKFFYRVEPGDEF